MSSDDDLTYLPPPRPGPRSFAPGEAVLGRRYRIDAVLEGGVEADAYRGTRIDDGAAVFIKYQSRRRGKHRVLVLERLLGCYHDGCVKLVEFDAVEQPTEIYEWVENEPLSALLERSVPFSDAQVRELVRQLAEALEYLHRQVGTAHRDVKPSNILVAESRTPRIKLADYGVMTLVEAGGSTVFAGTKKYAPPEALRWSLPRDSELMAYDWWSLGRVVQEIVDGIHPYDRLAMTLADRENEPDAIDALWSEVLSEQSRAKYGRAGQVEQSAEAWRPLLRGLLTTDREKRWGYSETTRWLGGETVPDAYDTPMYGAAQQAAERDANLVADVRRLSAPENWDEACRVVAESDGIVAQFRSMSDNKRVRTALRLADAAYDVLLRSTPAAIAGEVLAMLVLRVIGGPPCPLSLRGYELEVDLLLEWARQNESGIRELIAAFGTPTFLNAVEILAPEAGESLRAFASGWAETQRLLESWVPGAPVNRQIELIVKYSAQSHADNERLIDEARRLFASSRNPAVESAFRSIERSDAEAAALAFALAHAETFDFEAVENVKRRRDERMGAELAEFDAKLARERAENTGRMGFAVAGAAAGGILDAMLWAGAVSQTIASVMCVAGAIGGAVLAGAEGCGAAFGGLIGGGIVGALLGTVVSGIVRAFITGLGGPYVASGVFAAVGAVVGVLVRRRFSRVTR
jgi:hypothetical protein